jgi:hypothetical protein
MFSKKKHKIPAPRKFAGPETMGKHEDTNVKRDLVKLVGLGSSIARLIRIIITPS